MVQVPVPGLLYKDIGELLLGDRVTNLYRGDRAVRVKCLGREGGAVDTVLPHPPADHHDKVAGPGLLFMEIPSPMPAGHHPYRACKYEGLSTVTLIEIAPALRGGDPRTVPADTDAPYHPFKNLAGKEDGARTPFTPEQGRPGFRVTDAKPIAVQAGLCPETEADRVPVYPDDPGKCPTKRVECRGGIMSLNLVGHKVIIIEADRT